MTGQEVAMIKVTELELSFVEPVSEAVLGQLPGELHVSGNGRSAALDYPASVAPSMVLRALADWIDEHGIKVDEVNLETP